MALQETWKYDIQVPKSIDLKGFILGIAEKPSAAEKIASRLDSKSKKITFDVRKSHTKRKESFPLASIEGYLVKSSKAPTIIVSASGHLFTLISDSYGWQFPVYDFRWVSIPESERGPNPKIDPRYLAKIEATIEVMRMLIQKAKEHVIMTDYDEEGEVIGSVILDELSDNGILSHARRMRYSTFSEKEIIASYDKAINGSLPESGIDKGMYTRGLMRHYLDWLWGINLSRALMLSLKNTTGRYYTLSTGRVQGPTLSFVANRQEEINLFVPIPNFRIDVKVDRDGLWDLRYNSGTLDVEKTASAVIAKIKGNHAIVKDVSSNLTSKQPDVPYNLSELQKDAYRHFKITPSRTLRAAESLYLGSHISYPRTGSEKYPDGMDHLETLGKLNQRYSSFVTLIKKMNKKVIPVEGKKTDPAHPCIYPTGELPGQQNRDEERIYQLIIHRYFVTFGKNAKIETSKVDFAISDEEFSLSGKRTIDPGYQALMGKLNKSDDKEIPLFQVGEKVKLHSTNYAKRYSPPQAKFNQSSLLKEMEKFEIGTKATRSEIIKNLFDRNFLRNDPIDITPVGSTINDVLKTYSSEVISVDLSRKLEEMGDMIEESYNNGNGGIGSFMLSDAIVRGITLLHEMLEGLMVYQDKVGDMIYRNLISQQKTEGLVGECHVCNSGELRIIRSKASGKRFIGCSNYFTEIKCTNTMPLPQKGRISPYKKPCSDDNFPQIMVLAGRRPWIICLNPECRLKKARDEEIARSKAEKLEKKSADRGTKKKSTKKTTNKPSRNTAKSTKKTTVKKSSKSTSTKKSTKRSD